LIWITDIIYSVKRGFREGFVMRVSQEEKERTHEKIVASAARLLRERGIDSTSVADVMTDVGLTHGGFYRHFATKDDMVSAAIDSAFDQVLAMLADSREPGSEAPSSEIFAGVYLSNGHVGHPGKGCPVAALSTDVARAPERVRERFSAGVKRLVQALAAVGKGGVVQRRARAYRQLAMMAGAVMIARSSDEETAAEILAACRKSQT
jgi:TetR/AcrR family transcriptional repressor of nem operon